MVNVNDVRGAEDEVEKALRRLEQSADDGDVTPEDRNAIKRAWQTLRLTDWKEPLTQSGRIGELRMTSIRSGPLLEFRSPGDISEALSDHQEAGVNANSTLRSYSHALTAFFSFLDGETDYPDYDWLSSYTHPSREDDRKDPRDMLDDEEVLAIRQAMDHQRDKAFIELAVDTGLRISALCQLRTGDLDLSANPPSVRPNPNGIAQKGIKDHKIGRIDLKDSVHHVRGWVRRGHPEGPEPPNEAPLFTLLRGYDPEYRQEGAASPGALRKSLTDAADRAGVDKPISPHSLKHAAVKRFRLRYEMDWPAIKDRVLWSDSSLDQMMNRYGRLDADERRGRVQQQMGMSVKKGDSGQTTTHQECGNCGRNIPPTANFCPGCASDPEQTPGHSVSLSEVDEMMSEVLGPIAGAVGQVEEELGVEILDDEQREAVEKLRARNVELVPSENN